MEKKLIIFREGGVKIINLIFEPFPYLAKNLLFNLNTVQFIMVKSITDLLDFLILEKIGFVLSCDASLRSRNMTDSQAD